MAAKAPISKEQDIRAKQLLLEAVQLNRELESTKSLSHSLNGLAEVNFQQGNFGEALKFFKESIGLRIKLLDMNGLANSLNALAVLVEQMGIEDHAVILEGASTQIREKIGASVAPAARSENENFLIRLREKLGREKFDTAWFDGQTMSQAQILALVHDLNATAFRK